MTRYLLLLSFLFQIGCVGFMENVATGFIGNIVSDHINREIDKKSEHKNDG